MFEAPGIAVKVAAILPPVQLSANVIVSPLFSSSLIIFFTNSFSLCMIELYQK